VENAFQQSQNKDLLHGNGQLADHKTETDQLLSIQNTSVQKCAAEMAKNRTKHTRRCTHQVKMSATALPKYWQERCQHHVTPPRTLSAATHSSCNRRKELNAATAFKHTVSQVCVNASYCSSLLISLQCHYICQQDKHMQTISKCYH